MALNYSAIAQGLYAPDIAAEKGTAATEMNNVLATDQAESNTANDTYTKAANDAFSKQQGDVTKNDFTASSRGLFNSGLRHNANRLAMGAYQSDVATAAQDRADKLAALATKDQNARSTYNQKLGTLDTKFQSEVNSYTASHELSDLKTQENRAYSEQQYQTHRAQSRADTAARDAANGTGYTMKNSATTGGLNFTAKGGAPVTAAQYFSAKNNGNWSLDMVVNALNQSSNPNDQKRSSDIVNMFGKFGGQKANPSQQAQFLKAAQKQWPQIFGGV